MLPLVALLLAAPADDLKAKVDPLTAAFLKGKANAGVVVGVYRDKTPRVFGYGKVFVRTGEKTPAADTVFAIGSITKAFTGVLLAEGVRRGEVELDAPANDYLPADLKLPQTGDAPITLGHLATHTSGLPVEPPLIGVTARDGKNPYADFDRAALSGLLKKLKSGREPGKKVEYSNLGAGIVGHAVAHAAKAPSYDALLQQRVCRPLGMADTAEALTGDQLARLARGHTEEGKPGPHWDFATLSACGGLKSTAADLLRFAAAVAGDVKSDLAPALADSVTPRHGEHALFWVVDAKAGKPPLVWHNGGTTVGRAMLMVVPDKKVAVVVLCSRADEDADELAGKVLALLE